MVEEEVYGAHVRLRYATLINTLTRGLSVFASLLFVVSVTRRLDVIEFGTWTMIFKYISYVTPFAVIYSYWLPRTISRGINTSLTGLFLAFTLGLTATIAYTSIAYGVSIAFNQPLIPLMIASIIVFTEYVNSGLRSIVLSHSPQYVGVSTLTLRITQAILGLLLVVFWRLGLYGAVLAAILGRVATTMLLLIVNMKVIRRSSLDFETMRLWIKRAWLPLYSGFTPSILALDALVVRFFSGSEEPIAYYGIAFSVLSVVLISTQSLPALYSRLLAKRNIEDVVEVYWLIFMITTPLIMLVIAYAEPIAAIYSLTYVKASQVLRLFAIASIVQLLTAIFRTTLRGLESRDVNVENYGLRGTVLFKIPTINLIFTTAYVIILALTSYLIHDPILLASTWGIIYIFRLIAILTSYYRLLKVEFNVNLPIKTLVLYNLKFFISSLIIPIIAFYYPVEPKLSIYPLLQDLIPALLLAATSYFIILFIIDGKMRDLVRRVFEYLFVRS